MSKNDNKKKEKVREIEDCICCEYDGKGVSCCGFPCPVHSKQTKSIKKDKKCKCGHLYSEHWSEAECGTDLEDGLMNVCEKCDYAMTKPKEMKIKCKNCGWYKYAEWNKDGDYCQCTTHSNKKIKEAFKKEFGTVIISDKDFTCHMELNERDEDVWSWFDQKLKEQRRELEKEQTKKNYNYKGDRCIDCGKEVTIGSESGYCKRCMYKSDRSYKWKGDKAGYVPIHLWLKHHYKKRGICDFCGTARWTTFALKKGKKLSHNRANFYELCRPCHAKYDVKMTTEQRSKSYQKTTGILLGKRVKQYDLNGNFVGEYSSMSEASRVTGVDVGRISLCVNDKAHTAGNFIWKKS